MPRKKRMATVSLFRCKDGFFKFVVHGTDFLLKEEEKLGEYQGLITFIKKFGEWIISRSESSRIRCIIMNLLALKKSPDSGSKKNVPGATRRNGRGKIRLIS